MRWGLYLLLILVLIGTAEAATIHGTVYDFYLNKIDDGKVVIGDPKQQMVLVDSSYSFEVDEGEYNLYGYKLENGRVAAAAKEKIVVSGDGDYLVDLILFPYLGEEENILQESEDLFAEQTARSWPLILVLVGFAVAFFALVYLVYLKLKGIKKAILPKEVRELEPELKKVVNFIKQEGGRTTQKDIRREFPLSEGKVSLMISELEEKELVKRIRKGRGNIIMLK